MAKGLRYQCRLVAVVLCLPSAVKKLQNGLSAFRNVFSGGFYSGNLSCTMSHTLIHIKLHAICTKRNVNTGSFSMLTKGSSAGSLTSSETGMSLSHTHVQLTHTLTHIHALQPGNSVLVNRPVLWTSEPDRPATGASAAGLCLSACHCCQRKNILPIASIFLIDMFLLELIHGPE